jgi:ATP-dependent DNA ligase
VLRLNNSVETRLSSSLPYLPDMSSLCSRARSAPASFIEPCLLSPADRPPSGANWIHEIKHDGYRLAARRDSGGIRLLPRNGHDWANRFPLIVEAVNHLNVRSVLIDGEVVCCDERGLAVFEVLRQRERWYSGTSASWARRGWCPAPGVALQVRPVAGLSQVQEPAGSCGEAGGGRGLGDG